MPKTKKAVVIGGGLGGLACAIALRGKGWEVEVYEKNAHFGGKLNLLEKDGFKFDLGPSIFTMPHIFERLFARVGEDFRSLCPIQRLDLQWRNFFPDGRVFDLWDHEEKRNQEIARFAGKESVEQFQAYLNYSMQQLDLAEVHYLNKGVDGFWQTVKEYGLITSAFKIGWYQSMSGRIAQHVKNAQLQEVLQYFIKYVGSSAYDSPGLMSLLLAMQMRYGLWYVKGGMYALAKAMIGVCNKHGIKLNFGQKVVGIKRQKQKVTGIEVENGQHIAADVVVSNQEVVPAYRDLLQSEKDLVEGVEKRFKPACSGLVLHIGSRKQYSQLAHHNFFYSKSQKKHFDTVFKKDELPDDPTIYLVAPSRTDPGVCPEGMDNLKILPHIPPLPKSGSIDPNLYEKLQAKVLLKLEGMGLEGLRKHIEVEEHYTPIDLERMYLSNRGSIYGVACDRWANQGFKAPKKSTEYESLYFVGGSVNPGGGMPMVVLGGQQTADLIQ